MVVPMDSEDTTPTVDLWALPTNQERLAEAVDFEGKRVVDVGCGAGALVRFIRSQGADVLGVECGEVMIADAKAADPEHVGSYVDGVGQDLPVEDSSADVVVFSYSLHHVPAEHIADALVEAKRVLRPGGELVVLEPIADGPGFQLHRLIDDETQVRALAQAALDAAPSEFTETLNERFVSGFCYEDFGALEHKVVAIDPTRAEMFDSVSDQVKERFDQYAVEGPGGYWFEQAVHLRVFKKAS